VVQLPTYAPAYTPIEKLWKKMKQQATHLPYFPTFEALTEKVEQALLTFVLDCCILGDGRSLHVAMTVCCLANK
jgi:hypothetical protein